MLTRLLQVAATALVWAVLMGLSALVGLLFERGRILDPQVVKIVALYGAGGLIGYLFAHFPILWLVRRSSHPWSLLIAACVLTLFTLGATAGVLALEYRTYYAQWHGYPLSIVWFYQQFYTALGSTYQFAVLGTRLYWPLGPVSLVAMSWWLTRRAS